MHVVLKRVRSIRQVLVTKNPDLILSQPTELVIGVLELQISQLDFIDDIFSHLGIDRYVNELCLLGDFGLVEISS